MSTKTRTLTLGAAAIATAAATAFSSVATAQNALGSGRALDHGLQQGARVNRPTSDFASELRLRNSIVTGNAPGGASFRGLVGYRAENDFRTDPLAEALFGVTGVGSDDLFSFERDSFFSAAAPVRGIDALQFQMQLSTGSLAGEVPVLPIVRRPSATPESDLMLGGGRFEDLRGATLDAYSITPGTLRSTSEFLSSSLLEPSVLSATRPDDVTGLPSFTIATPLRGVATQTTPGYATDLLPPDSLFPGARSMDRTVRDATSPNRISGMLESTRSSYETILEDLRAVTRIEPGRREPGRPGAQPQTTPSRPFGLPDIEQPEIPDPTRAVPDPASEVAPDAAMHIPSIEDRLEQVRRAMRPHGPAGDEDPGDVRRQVDQTLSMLKTAQPRIAAYAPETNQDRDFFAEHMNHGQKLLAERRWFDAEEHFASALSSKPGDALAAAGRVHAQIGAGLFLSASVNVHRLLRDHPGMLSVKYDRALLPSEERLRQVIGLLRENIAHRGETARNSGLILAYVGFQIDDQSLVTEGFDAIDRATEQLEEEPDPFYEVLRKVWLD